MASLAFRNIDADPGDPVATWGVEGILTAIDRGGPEHWARIAKAVTQDPEVLADAEQAVTIAEDGFGRRWVARAIDWAHHPDKRRLAQTISWIDGGLFDSDFAELATRTGISELALRQARDGTAPLDDTQFDRLVDVVRALQAERLRIARELPISPQVSEYLQGLTAPHG